MCKKDRKQLGVDQASVEPLERNLYEGATLWKDITDSKVHTVLGKNNFLQEIKQIFSQKNNVFVRVPPPLQKENNG